MASECVCCGKELPEGYGDVCKDCEAAELNVVEAAKKRIRFSYGNNPCVHIHNSYLVTRNEDIEEVLEYIRGMNEYKKLKEVGYTRTPQSEFNEWKGHNFFYRIGLLRSRTGSVDIDQNEPKWRRAVYAILSMF